MWTLPIQCRTVMLYCSLCLLLGHYRVNVCRSFYSQTYCWLHLKIQSSIQEVVLFSPENLLVKLWLEVILSENSCTVVLEWSLITRVQLSRIGSRYAAAPASHPARCALQSLNSQVQTPKDASSTCQHQYGKIPPVCLTLSLALKHSNPVSLQIFLRLKCPRWQLLL